jgi:NAD(P)-dependent dehydrogenase (short-subunit alcohol dehydrogenase family)
MAVNFYGNLYFFRHMAGAMSRGGSIVVVASIAATAVTPGHLLYGCAKAATITAMKYAALEYAPRQIRINALVPGLVGTRMIAPLIASDELLQVFMKETPLKRIADPVEIADAALWLSSSPSITGTTVVIDGGVSLRRPPQPEEFPT